MKRIFAIALLLVATSVTTFAQAPASKGAEKPKKTPEERATAYANAMEKKLGLSAEQKTKVHDLALTRSTKMTELREKYKGQDKKVWKDERKKARDDFQNGMKSTLSPEQYIKWLEMQKKRAQNKVKGKGKGKIKPAETPSDEGDVDPELDGE